MAECNGYPSWNAWNVSLWINNSEDRYYEAYEMAKKHGLGRAARILTDRWAGDKTPDGATYNARAIRLAIMDIL